ncbi:C-type lectin domain family 4 member K-like [Neocloeon triangulifer]|uniref:C-type lectin domain family 4 member K-like n=1 Tax=Neocloeon triangulifer TaxID=2078957 RepID=UPI00286F6777|nr:C-type lectin domain family 4 member K-like [Neocloeon triangulifer]
MRIASAALFSLVFASLAAAESAPSAESEAVSNISININAGNGPLGHCDCQGEFMSKVDDLNKTLLLIGKDMHAESKKIIEELREMHKKLAQKSISSIPSELSDASKSLQLKVSSKTNSMFDDFKFNKSYPKYYFGKSDANWYDADKFCKQHGVQLVSVQNYSKAVDVWKFASTYSWSNVWTSGTDQSREPGDFHWLTGTRVLSDLFKNGEPNEYGFEVDVCLAIHDRALADFACSERYFFVCEDLKAPY